MRNPLTLYMPVEIKARELHGRVLMSCIAVERGMTAVLGQVKELRGQLAYLSPGVYVSKSATKTHAAVFDSYRKLGHRIVAWDEEGLVFLSEDQYQRYKVSAESLASVDLFFAWGKNQVAAILGKVPAARDKMVLSGNHRFDVLQEEYRSIHLDDTRKIAEEYGDFILINGTFGRYNHYLGVDDQFDDLVRSGLIETEEDKRFFLEWVEHDKKEFHAFQALIDSLASNFPGSTIVLRPHPSEKFSVWHDFARQRDNFRVVFEDSAVPWILASQVMLHAGCTTGIEAYFLEHPAICYRTVASSIYNPELPHLLNHKAGNVREVCDLVGKALSGDLPPRPELNEDQLARARSFIDNFNGALASDQIVDKLLRANDLLLIEDPLKARLARFARRTKRVLRQRAYSQAKETEQPLAGYKAQKFPGLTRDELQSCIDKFTAATGRFANTVAEPIGGTKTCYRIRSARGAI